MINLLPKFEKKQVKKEYIIRFLTVTSIVFSVFIISATIPLAISYITIYYNIAFINEISDSLSRSDSFKEMNNLIKTTKETNRKIKILVEPIGKTSREDITGVFNNIFKIADDVKDGQINVIKINQLSYEQIQKKGVSTASTVTQATTTQTTIKESGNHKITIRGFAAKREDFLFFLKHLELDKNFVSIDSPVSNLVESRNINFLITITLKDNKVI